MTPTTILLVRHGRTATTGRVLPGRAPGLHLSARGRRQAERVGAEIAALEPRPLALYCSPLERARETAGAIARATGLRARVERGLNECDFGEWTGASLARLRRRREWSLVQHAPSVFRFPGGESFDEMRARAWTTLERLAERHPGETIVAVSHADPIKAVVTHALGVPLDLFQRTEIGTCSVSVLVLGAGPARVRALNVTTLAEVLE